MKKKSQKKDISSFIDNLEETREIIQELKDLVRVVRNEIIQQKEEASNKSKSS